MIHLYLVYRAYIIYMCVYVCVYMYICKYILSLLCISLCGWVKEKNSDTPEMYPRKVMQIIGG